MPNALKPLSVSEINFSANEILGAHFSDICVAGEISEEPKPRRDGHLYFKIKDQKSVLNCALFANRARFLKTELKLGSLVLCYGRLNIYSPSGNYSLICDKVEPQGIGALAAEFERLKAEFILRGYFDSSHKVPLPRFPKKVALITSASGAVIEDMQKIAKQRWPLCEFTCFDVPVQGQSAAVKLASAIELVEKINKKAIESNIKSSPLSFPQKRESQIDSIESKSIESSVNLDSIEYNANSFIFNEKKAEFQAIIIGRGGGSAQDLWCFNSPILVEAIYKAQTPIISAVGHETDTTLSDLVADVRASTPSDAIRLLLPDQSEYFLHLSHQSDYLDSKAKQIFLQAQNKINQYKNHLEKGYIKGKLESNLLKISHKQKELKILLNNIIQTKQNILKKQEISAQNILKNHISQLQIKLLENKSKLNLYDLNNILSRGFIQVLKDGKINKDLSLLKSGDLIELQDKTNKKQAKIQ